MSGRAIVWAAVAALLIAAWAVAPRGRRRERRESFKPWRPLEPEP